MKIRVEEIKNKVLALDRDMQGFVEQNSNILMDNENITRFIHCAEDQGISKEQDPNTHSIKDMTLDEGARKQTRSSTRKRETLAPN